MTEFFLVLISFIVGWKIGDIINPSHKVNIKIMVDSKQAIKDLNEAEEAIKRLKKEMNV